MYHTLLHPTDLSENHYALCQKALDIAKRFHATLYLLHVIEPPATLQVAQSLGFAQIAEPAKEDALAVMKVLGESLGLPESQLIVEVGSPKQWIIDKAKALSADCILVGSHNPLHFAPYLGSTAYAVVHHAECDVLTIRG